MEERGTLYIFDLEFVLLQNSSVFLLLRFVMGSEFKETFKKKNPLNKFIDVVSKAGVKEWKTLFDVVLIIFGRQFLTAPLFKGSGALPLWLGIWILKVERDGYVARKMKINFVVSSYLDPFVDKLWVDLFETFSFALISNYLNPHHLFFQT